MKTTAYFDRVTRRKHPEANREDWIEGVLSASAGQDAGDQPEGRIALTGFILEAGRWMRVIVEEDGETVHTAFFVPDYDPQRE